MPVPKKRTSRSRRDKRRAHDFLVPNLAVSCPNCGSPVLPHRVCLSCGQYKGRSVIAVQDQTQG